MASNLKNLSEYKQKSVPSGIDMKIGIIVSEWNEHITSALLDGCVKTLLEHNVPEESISVVHVPGTYELTSGAAFLNNSAKVDGIVCLGCVVKGETRHDEYINSAVANGLTNLSLKLNKPMIFGVLTVENMLQAVDRAGGKHGNKGIEAAVTVLKMIQMNRTLNESSSKIGFKENKEK